jgi:hypothetical protein
MARLIAGSAMWCNPLSVNSDELMPRNSPTSPRPDTGNQPRLTENTMIRMIACQKFGTLKPRIDPAITAWLPGDPWRSPA